jgi:hypothetical protein
MRTRENNSIPGESKLTVDQRIAQIADKSKYKGDQAEHIVEYLSANPHHILFAEFISAGLKGDVNPKGLSKLASSADRYGSYRLSIEDALTQHLEDKSELSFVDKMDILEVETLSDFIY